jgi:polyribonucleotide nucleotidyltransferase
LERVEFEVGGKKLAIETGRLARQSNGSVVVSSGDSAVLVTANASTPRPGIDFFPLTVDYFEKSYAAGRIPGGFFKREGRQSEKEILTSRFIDRALRPLFPEGYNDETQIIATVMACEEGAEPDTLAFIGASAALLLSDIPFPAPIAALRVARSAGKFLLNPGTAELEGCDLSVIVAGSRDAIVMVEGGALEVSEADMLSALRFGHQALQPILDAQEELARRVGKAKRALVASAIDPALRARLEKRALGPIRDAIKIPEKKARYSAIAELESAVKEEFVAPLRAQPRSFASLADVETAQREAAVFARDVSTVLHDLRAKAMRERILDGEPRIDGRSSTDIRPIQCQVPAFGRVHGSAIFTRGETQALVAVTLGGTRDEMLIEGLGETVYRSFYLHYNFPPFSVGETKPLRGPNRREQGHGALAQRSIHGVLPEQEAMPYTLRIVSEILESNGSSSMATVCAASLALMDAGIAIKAPVAGIAMGLIQEGKRFAVLSDILGDEDHLGDMDFKVAGTRGGITAIQMDIKIEGLDWTVMSQALEQARQGRLHILNCMERETREALVGFAPRATLSDRAPRVEVLWIKPDRIRDLIGPGGKVIRAIQESCSAKIDVEDSGKVVIFAPNVTALQRCRSMVEETTQEAEIGRLYVGRVKRVTDFGAFVEIFPGTDGLLHISELTDRRVERVEDVCAEGDEVVVKCIDVDPSGKIRLSRRAALAEVVEAAAQGA